MTKLFDIINIPLGYVMRFFADIFGGNFALSVFVFTFIIDLLLIPLTIKSQKSTVQQMRIKPKLDELKKRYGNDRQKMAEAQQKLYQEENVKMAGGCGPLIVRLILLFSIYSLILSPLTYMSGASKDSVSKITVAVSDSMDKIKKKDKDKYEEYAEKIGWQSSQKNSANQLGIIKVINDDTGVVKEILGEKKYKKIEKDLTSVRKKVDKTDIDYTLFGKIDLTDKPTFNIDIIHSFELTWLLPLGAFLAQILTGFVSMRINKINNPDAPSMAGMMLTMPLISLFIGFTFPCGVCFYWICSSVVGCITQVAVQIFYGPQKLLARERAKEIIKECEFEEKQLEKFDGKSGELF